MVYKNVTISKHKNNAVKKLQLTFTLKYKRTDHNFQFGGLEGDITEPKWVQEEVCVLLGILTEGSIEKCSQEWM